MYKEYFTNYKSFISELQDQEKNLRNDLTTYKEKIGKGENTIDFENKFTDSLTKFKKSVEKLNEAYSSKNVPSTMPENIVDARQKEINQLKNNYDEINKDYKKLNDDKYSFKGHITEDYHNKEEFQGKSTEELLLMEKDKLNQQNDKIDLITTDAKKGTQMAKNLRHELKDQTKKIEQVNEDIDMADSRMKRLTERFGKYGKKASICCLGIFLLIEAVIFGLLVWIYSCVGTSDGEKWTCNKK